MTNWKTVETGISDHFTCLLRNLNAGQEARVRIVYGPIDWFRIEKEVWQSCWFSPCICRTHHEKSQGGWVISWNQDCQETNTWRLNNTFLNNQQVTEEIKREIKKFLETNDNENMTTQNLWDAAKAVLRGKLIAIQSYLKKQEKHWLDNLTLHLK